MNAKLRMVSDWQQKPGSGLTGGKLLRLLIQIRLRLLVLPHDTQPIWLSLKCMASDLLCSFGHELESEFLNTFKRAEQMRGIHPAMLLTFSHSKKREFEPAFAFFLYFTRGESSQKQEKKAFYPRRWSKAFYGSSEPFVWFLKLFFYRWCGSYKSGKITKGEWCLKRILRYSVNKLNSTETVFPWWAGLRVVKAWKTMTLLWA